MTTVTRVLGCVLVAVLVAAPARSQEGVAVTFVVLDAFVKDRPVVGAAVTVRVDGESEPVADGVTDDGGRFETVLPPGTYRISYAAVGYVPLTTAATEVRGDGQVITTALSMLLEAEGSTAARRIRLILTWGFDESQVRDADAHLVCAADGNHVYFASKEHLGDAHRAVLDVDDMDWGGPETITVSDPEPGRYTYWVHDYSGPPAVLGGADVVVRVVFDDEMAGEFRLADDAQDREWRPFAALVVGDDLRPRIEPFTDEELARRADRQVPEEYRISGSSGDIPRGIVAGALIFTAIAVLLVFGGILVVVMRR